MYFIENKCVLSEVCLLIPILPFPKSSMIMTFETPINRFCSIFGHNFKLVSKINEDTSELACKCCNNHFISTNNGNITNLTVYGEMKSFPNYFKSKRGSRFNRFIGFE